MAAGICLIAARVDLFEEASRYYKIFHWRAIEGEPVICGIGRAAGSSLFAWARPFVALLTAAARVPRP